MYVLTNTHAPQNHRRFGFSKLSGHHTQALCRNSANGSHCFRTVTLDVLFEGFKIRGAVLNKLLITQALFDDCVNHGIEHRYIGIGLKLQCLPSVLSNIGDARICQHNFGTVLGSIFHPRRCNWVIGGRIRTDHHNEPRVLNIIYLITHRTGANTFKQGSYARGVA